ncbi:MAG: S-layer protein [Methanotrichaceae archaeon]|nr:S-layer protein [Methanotrichaceae archaeon]
MRSLPFLIVLIALMPSALCEAGQVNGEVQFVVDGASYIWNAQNFAGFCYDIDDNLGCEQIEIAITGNELEEPTGVRYSTSRQSKGFEFADWGRYYAIGFLGESYFAGYEDGTMGGWDCLHDGLLFSVLRDELCKITVSSLERVTLEDGYSLGFSDVGDEVLATLFQNEMAIDSVAVTPPGDVIFQAMRNGEKYTHIAAHLSGWVRMDPSYYSINGIFQISKDPILVDLDDQYDQMRVASVDADSISMDNKGHAIALINNEDIALMAGIHIKTADQDDISAEDPLRFYVYKEMSEPATCTPRGAVTIVVDGMAYTWTPKTFTGFYYDIDDDLGCERIDISITDNKLEEPCGVRYSTSKQEKEFGFEDWGWYYSIGFLGENYFAGYSDRGVKSGATPRLYDASGDANTLVDEQISRVLIDSKESHILKGGERMDLAEGYQITIRPDVTCEKALLELYLFGSLIDRDYFDLPNTYVYKLDLGDTRDIVLLAVHVGAADCSQEAAVIVDGIFQISQEAYSVAVDTIFGKMRIAAVSSDGITMDNKDNSMTLSRGQKIALAPGLILRTANQREISAEEPLRMALYGG